MQPVLRSWVPLAAAAAALLLAAQGQALAPRGPLGQPLAFAALLLSAAAAGLHRPLGGSGLGLGAMALPPALALLGAVPAAWIAGGALLAIELAQRALARASREPPGERRRAVRALETAAGGSLAALGAGAAWWAAGPALAGAASAGAAAYLLLAVALRLLAHHQHRPAERLVVGALLLPLALDLAGWGLGVAVTVVAREVGAGTAAVLGGALAALSAEAFRNARLSDRLSEHVQELAAVSRAGERVGTGGGELAALAGEVRSECARLVPHHGFQLELFEAGAPARSWASGPDGDLFEGRARPDRRPPARPGIHRQRSWKVLAYPLEAEGRVLARLSLWCDPKSLDEAQAGLLESLLPQLAASVHRALLDREAKRDPLTGVAARRVLADRLAEAFGRCREEGEALAVVLCDLDHFKRINDTHGHEAGDRALVAVGRLLGHGVPPGGLCCRYGGEEFLLLLPGTDGGRALALADRLRAEVSELELAVGDQPIPVSMSAGIASYPELYVGSAEELPALADAALYEAKRRGRNLCLLALGRGRFRSPQGRLYSSPAATAAPEPPRLFA